MDKIFISKNDDQTIEEVVRLNIKKAAEVRKELAMLKDKDDSQPIDYSYQDTPILEEKKEVNNKDTYDQEEYKYYYDNIIEDLRSADSLEEKENAVIQNLPCMEAKNYANIINRMKLELLKKLFELEAGKEDDKDLLLTFLHLLDYASNYQIQTDSKNLETTSNKLVFLSTDRGNVYAYKDLSGLETAYPYFQGLLESIENGTFKGVKRFDNNSDLAGISEVRDYQSRVVFDRIDKNTYVVLHMFIKKSTNSTGYRNMLSTRIGYYRKVREQIKNKLNDPDYLLMQEEIRANLLQILETKDVGMIKKLNRGDK